MAKYFTLYNTFSSPGTAERYSVYYDQISENNYVKLAYTNDSIVKTFSLNLPGEIAYNPINVEVPDSASSIIVVRPLIGTQVFPLDSAPPTMSTLFLTFDTF